jgi:hypothetical protein
MQNAKFEMQTVDGAAQAVFAFCILNFELREPAD